MFDGTWENSELKYGKCTYPSGDTYEGEWKEGRPDGKGVKTWHDGRKYEGEFFSGKPIGTGTKYTAEGEKIAGYWIAGKFFQGKPAEGLMEKQYQELVRAKEIYQAEKKSYFNEQDEETGKTIFADKGNKTKQKKALERPTSPTSQEDMFKDKR